MTKKELFTRFDRVMANIKPIEPTVAFELEFKRRLNEAVAAQLKETALEAFARRAGSAVESLRYALLPPQPVLARVAAACVVMISVGLYIYSAQPQGPLSIAAEGVVLVQGPNETGWKKLALNRAVKVGDVVATGGLSQVDIELSNRYAIRIKENAKIRVAKLAPRYGKGIAQFDLIEGKALVSISEGFKGSKFTVNTKAGTATALGTKFAVDVSKDGPKAKVSVLEGKVEVKGSYKPQRLMLAKETVVLAAGQKTEVTAGSPPLAPQRLLEKEWLGLEELYQIGRKPQVILLIKNRPDRVIQLLAPCPIYVSDEKPREIPELFDEAVLNIAEAVKTKDAAKHLESIKMLEKMLEEHPNPKYDVQFLLYIGAYYEYLLYHEDAIKTFEKVLRRYPDSPLASLAQAAIGVIYEEKLHDINKAREAFKAVLDNYPYSLEAIWVEEKLGIKKVS